MFAAFRSFLSATRTARRGHRTVSQCRFRPQVRGLELRVVLSALPFIGPIDTRTHAAPQMQAGPDIGGTTADMWLGTDINHPTWWNVDDNWSLGHYPDHNSQNTEESAVFNGSHNNPCEVNGGIFPIISVSWNQAYNATITIDSGVDLDTDKGFTNDGTALASIYFSANTSVLEANAGASTTGNFSFRGQEGQVLMINLPR